MFGPRSPAQEVASRGVGYAERQRLGYELRRDLVADLAAGLTANLHQTFADLLEP